MLACLQIVFKNDKDSGKVFYVLKEDYEKKCCNGTSDTSIGMHKLCSLVVINSLGLERFDITRVSCVSVNAKF